MQYEPRHENTSFLLRQKQRRGSAMQHLCFCYIESTITLYKSKISSLKPSSVVVQPDLCGTWSETPKISFLTTRHIWFQTSYCITGM